MLTYDGKLHYDGTIITKADSIISLEMVEDVACFGILTLSNEVTKVSTVHQTREHLIRQDLSYLKKIFPYIQ